MMITVLNEVKILRNRENPGDLFPQYFKRFLHQGQNSGLYSEGLTLSQMTNLDSSKLKEFADNNSKI